ncbi:MAG: hypothetical protein ACM3IL_05440 [Deltaproteobacteria bacterium]
MRKIRKTIACSLLFCLVFFGPKAFAQYQYASQEDQGDARYVIKMVKGSTGTFGRTYGGAKTPAVVLDTATGIVWRCANLQEEKPLWIKTDLGKNGNQPPGQKKYMLQMLEWPSTELKIPAVVIDVEEGKVWTCSNLLEEGSPWTENDLIKGAKSEGTAGGYNPYGR